MNSPLPSVPESHLATRVALLDAAERLFSQNGIEGTSIRDIVKEAGTNVGAINYHFGTKDRLALEVFARRLQPVNRERIARLNALEASTKPGELTLEQILDALWGDAFLAHSRSLDVHLTGLRSKLQLPGFIINVRGVGYRVEQP